MNGWFIAWIIGMFISMLIHLSEADSFSDFFSRMVMGAIGWVILLAIIRFGVAVVSWLFTM